MNIFGFQRNQYIAMESRLAYLYLYILFIVSFGYAQNTYRFEHLTTNQGLSQSDVNTIFQDKKGFMWFGTHDGLNKYDGHQFKVYRPQQNSSNNISSNLIWQITDDIDRNLWIATTGGGLNHFDLTTEEFTSFTHDPEKTGSIIHDYISTLYRDSKNRIWVGTSKGINYADVSVPVNEITFQTSYAFDNTAAQVFFEDSKGQLWMGGQNGLYKLMRNNEGALFFQQLSHLKALQYGTVKAIVEDNGGSLILGTTRGLYQYFPDKKDNLQFVQSGVFTDLTFVDGTLWAGSENGLYTFAHDAQYDKLFRVSKYEYDPRNPDYSLSKNSVKSIFKDNTGIVWVGVNGGGVNKYDPLKKQFTHIKKGPEPGSISNDKVRTVFEDSQGALWIGTEGGGLNFISKNDRLKSNFRFSYANKMSKVYAIEEVEMNGSKRLLVGGQNSPGLFEIQLTNSASLSNKNLKPIPNVNQNIFSIKQDKNNHIWIGTYNGGVHRWLLNNQNRIYKKDILRYNANKATSLSNDIIRHVFEDSKGNIWFATGNGLNLLTSDQKYLDNPSFKVFFNNPEQRNSLSHNYVLTIFESKIGELWIGTFGGGLNKLTFDTKTGTYSFQRYAETDGLSNNVIKGILEDEKGNLWLSTNKGINKFNPQEETFQTYDVNDGLQSNEFSELAAVKAADGAMFFGGVNGLNLFYPEEIVNNNKKANVAITKVFIFNNPIAVGEAVNGRVLLETSLNNTKSLELNHDENSVTFEFAALHYAAPEKNAYAYKLEGFDQDWIYTSSSNRKANYTNLSHGTYTLKIKASNNDNVWNETPVTLEIIISPPWWKTTFANIGYLLLGIALLMAFRKFTIIRSTKKHQLELEYLEKEKNDEIQRLKLEFFTNISHEFRTPLTLIKGPMDYLIKKGNSLSAKEINEQYGLVVKNTNYLLRLVNQLLDFRKLDHGKMNLSVSKNNIVVFLQDVSEPFQFLGRKRHINFDVSASKPSLKIWFDPTAIEKIVYNLLSNAFKFTPDSGSVTLRIDDGASATLPEALKVDFDVSNYVVLQVKDTGPGIPEHRIKQIFERYYSNPSLSNLQRKGTGIGLSFTKNLVELHQGVIRVISDSNNGTSFFVFLPKSKAVFAKKDNTEIVEVFDNDTFISQVDAESHAISLMDDIEDSNINRSRSDLPVLLIVDDNADIRSFVKKGLGEHYYIYEAEDGQKGLELANKILPSIIITDIMMPNMNGIELCNQLKMARETSHIAVVMLTAKTSHEIEIEGLKTGADAYIRKPFDIELLELKLSNILKRRQELRKRFNSEIVLEPSEITVTSSDEKFLKRAIEITENNIVNPDFSVSFLVKEMSMSRSNLYLKIKELTGLTSSEFIRNIRLKRAIKLFDSSDLSVKEIMYMTGFNTASYFSKCFKKQFGVVPSMYIRQHENSVKEKQDIMKD